MTNYTPEHQIKPKSGGRVKCSGEYYRVNYQKGDAVGRKGVLKASLEAGLSSSDVKLCALGTN